MLRFSTILAIALGFSLSASPARAVIKVLTPLKQVLDSCDPIVVLEVDKVDAEKKITVWKWVENLKGKSPVEKFTVNLTGDAFARKEGHTQVMLDRLATGRKMVLFINVVDSEFVGFGFLEGTWFQVHGAKDGEMLRLAFLHCEPYFRRTFHGTTEELRTTVIECLAGKRKPPEPDEKQMPGYGPTAQPPQDPKKEDRKEQSRGMGGPLFGVIPSFVVVGPIAVLSALFPTLFAGLATGLKRWRGYMLITTVNSLISCAYTWLRDGNRLPDTPLLSPLAMSILILGVTVVGAAWTGRRYRRAVAEDSGVSEPPGGNEFFAMLAAAGVMSSVIALIIWLVPVPWSSCLSMPMRELSALVVGLLTASVYSLYRTVTRSVGVTSPRMSAPGEAVALLGVFSFILALTCYDLGRNRQTPIQVQPAGDSEIHLLDAELLYENPDSSLAYSGVAVAGDRIYAGSLNLKSSRGVITCIDRATGKVHWNRSDALMLNKGIYSTPAIADGRLYVGEGTHENSGCRLLCYSLAGEKLWSFDTASHTEGNPLVHRGRVYFSAGDDGIFCLDAETGQERWHFQGSEQKLHIDSNVVIVDGLLYAGSGYNTLAAFALDAETGRLVWKKELALRSFSQPVVAGGMVYLGLGTGRLTEDLNEEDEPGRAKEKLPAGLVVGLNAKTGETVWQCELPRPVHTPLSHDAVAVYAACRDGTLYAISRQNGVILWKFHYGTPLTSGMVAASQGEYPLAVYSVSAEGQVFCHRASDGRILWGRHLREITDRAAEILTTPTLVESGNRRELYLHVSIIQRNGQKNPAILRFKDGPKPGD